MCTTLFWRKLPYFTLYFLFVFIYFAITAFLALPFQEELTVTGKATSFSRPVQAFSLGRVSLSMFLGQESAIAESLGTFEKILTDATFFQSLCWCKESTIYSRTPNRIRPRQATASVSRQEGESVAALQEVCHGKFPSPLSREACLWFISTGICSFVETMAPTAKDFTSWVVELSVVFMQQLWHVLFVQCHGYLKYNRGVFSCVKTLLCSVW